MKFYKAKKQSLVFLCVLSILLSIFPVSITAEAGKTVTATTEETIKQGAIGTCYVYIDSLDSLTVLDVSVQFDSTKVKVNDMFNSVSCTLYENSKNYSSVQFSYTFDGKGASTSTRLFYFTYQVLSDAEAGDTYFDITIEEAYDNTLETVAVSGTGCAFRVEEVGYTVSYTLHSRDKVSVNAGDTFLMWYQFNDSRIVSGSVAIYYDKELFEVYRVIEGGLLSNKVYDVNINTPGVIYISFAGSEYNRRFDLADIMFKAIKNVDTTSNFTCQVTELYDIDRNSFPCRTNATTVTIKHDPTYVGDSPKMQVSATYDEATDQVTANISLGSQSHLGAGDFVLSFDPEVLSLSSYEKCFSPDYFGVNTTGVADGKLMFSIISMEDIVSKENVLTVKFDVKKTCQEQMTDLGLAGSVLTDSLTNTILLNLLGGQVSIPEGHSYTDGLDTSCDNCDHTREVYCKFIEITQTPTKLTYLEGEELDTTGMIVTAHYDENTSVVVADYEVSGYTSTLGTKTITVSCEGHTATFTVTVNTKVPSILTSSIYTIKGTYVSKITAGTTVSTLLSGLNEGAYCKVYNGNSVVSGTTSVGTGMLVKIMDGDTVKATYTIIVTGDTNGDGNITITDMIAIKAHVLKKSTLSGVYAIAADTNGDNGISVTDFIQVKAKILGKGTITAR